jgi:chromosome partitioning protein
MMTKFIGVVQLKGGAGRSTVATTLAACLSKSGRTLLIDADMPQGTSASWYALREDKGMTGHLSLATATSHKEMLQVIKDHAAEYEYIVFDTPPRIAEITDAVLMLVDLVLVPIATSSADIWATQDLLESISQVSAQRDGLTARVLWNKYRGYTKSAQTMSESVKKELPIKAMKTTLGMRVSYADALGEGLACDEWKDKAAKAEVEQLTKEVIRLLR